MLLEILQKFENLYLIFYGTLKFLSILHQTHSVLWSRSRSWNRKEPEPLAGAYTEVSAPAPGQTKVVYLIIIPIE